MQTLPVVGAAIAELIPQREPFVLVDTFYGIVDGESVAGLHVQESTAFVHGSVLDECGLVEHMAQACAARAGYICKCNATPVPLGYIAALSRMRFTGEVRVGQEVRTGVRIVQDFGSLLLASVTAKVEGQIVADGEMKIFLNP